ncbi:MAG: transcription elongation factor subunit Spt4 [Candidatus Helarchaeota archaeon]
MIPAKAKACRECRYIEEEPKKCSNCGSINLSSDYSGLVIIFDPDSLIAKKLQIKKPGKYALKIR